MPQGTKRVEKVKEGNFPQIKEYIAAHGQKAAQEHYGYSVRTIRTIAKASDYKTWREKRQRQQSGNRHKAVVKPQPVITPQAPAQSVQSVTPNQAINPIVIRKPGHGLPVAGLKPRERATTSAGQDPFFVTHERTDRDIDESFEEIQEQIIREDQARKSPWQRLKERFGL